MGELKQLNEAQQTLIERVKSLGEQVYLANLGLASKVEEEGKKQYDKVIAAGTTARAEANKATQVAFGLLEVLKAEGEKLKAEAEKLRAEGFKPQVDALKARFDALNLKEEAQKLFGDLVAAGEKRKAA